MMSSKQFFIERVLRDLSLVGKDIRILDMGCGKAEHWVPILKKHPAITYVGIEPNPTDVARAEKNLNGITRATVKHQPGYGDVGSDFDLVISLSVLEHVKYLDAFVRASGEAVKKGGFVVHRYDHGHALYPSGAKEYMQVWLSRTVPTIVPESKFVTYVKEDIVTGLMKRYGIKVTRSTYHQMPDHKSFLKKFHSEIPEAEACALGLSEWEFAISPFLHTLVPKERDLLFPTVAVWGERTHE